MKRAEKLRTVSKDKIIGLYFYHLEPSVFGLVLSVINYNWEFLQLWSE